MFDAERAVSERCSNSGRLPFEQQRPFRIVLGDDDLRRRG